MKIVKASEVQPGDVIERGGTEVRVDSVVVGERAVGMMIVFQEELGPRPRKYDVDDELFVISSVDDDVNHPEAE